LEDIDNFFLPLVEFVDSLTKNKIRCRFRGSAEPVCSIVAFSSVTRAGARKKYENFIQGESMSENETLLPTKRNFCDCCHNIGHFVCGVEG